MGTTGHQELQKRRSELREPQGRQTEARETVMKCKGNHFPNHLHADKKCASITVPFTQVSKILNYILTGLTLYNNW